MANLIDGKVVSKIIKSEVEENTKKLLESYNITPSLHAILIGDDIPSQTYVTTKKKICESLGIKSEIHQLPKNTSQKTLENLIHELNEQNNIHGILVQLPLPTHIETYKIMDTIDPLKDVDGFTPTNVAKLARGEDCLEPCTPKGILKLLDYYNIHVEGEHVVILGRSDIVGRPLFNMMSSKKRNATVTLCHSRTKYMEDFTTSADILISAIGEPKYIIWDMVKYGAVVIDVGINRVEINRVEDPSDKRSYRLVGDVDFEHVKNKVRYITPVPGGVGPMTIACLMENTVKACLLQNPQITDII